jgi:SAM-dependent methyltransferase
MIHAQAGIALNDSSLRTRFWHELGRQLRNPTGRKGRWVGQLMSVVNQRPNLLAIEALQSAQADSMLELGVGSGWALGKLAGTAKLGRIWGIDQSTDMLLLAARRNRLATQQGRVSLAQARFDALPFSGAFFDRILAVNVAYFFERDGRDFREARRVLRPGGRMIIYVSDRATLAAWPFAGEDTHRSYDRDELIAAISSGGFAKDEIAVATVRLPLGVSGLLATVIKQP